MLPTEQIVRNSITESDKEDFLSEESLVIDRVASDSGQEVAVLTPILHTTFRSALK